MQNKTKQNIATSTDISWAHGYSGAFWDLTFGREWRVRFLELKSSFQKTHLNQYCGIFLKNSSLCPEISVGSLGASFRFKVSLPPQALSVPLWVSSVPRSQGQPL